MTAPAILIVEKDAMYRGALQAALQNEEQPVLTAADGARALEILDTQNIGLVVSDLQIQPMDGMTLLTRIREHHPGLPAVLMATHGRIEDAVASIRNGAIDFLQKPVAIDDLNCIVRKHLKHAIDSSEPIAVDAASVKLLQIARRVATTDVSVTISGPSGCGKEIFSRYIHSQSPRCEQAFVAINCAAIPESMLEAVLFGYEKGAFTGAVSAHAGKFEQATGGTLLLDEISEMDLGLQAKLLRVIQEKEVERLGGRDLISLDVRIIATTNRDLRQHVADGLFREDLYYRLNVFPLHIPPLCERRDDILPLVDLLLQRYTSGAIVMSDCAQDAVLAYDWPGNVRELENLMQRTLILLSTATIRAADLAFEAAPGAVAQSADLNAGLKRREFQLILDALSTHKGKRTDVASALGISPRSLRYKLARMREAGIDLSGKYYE
jgi:two-component system response regulator FlrC